MSTCLSSKNGVKARKPSYCALCGERINIGDAKDVRSGVSYGDFWTMHMHPECHAYEQTPKMRESLEDWYGASSQPAFARADALASLATAPTGLA